ncbi:MAG TPA: hypothetical protein VJ783_04085 [Pirellulales bacterium]|nr:hypothetical protein [Pirellulales bacterium]
MSELRQPPANHRLSLAQNEHPAHPWPAARQAQPLRPAHVRQCPPWWSVVPMPHVQPAG